MRILLNLLIGAIFASFGSSRNKNPCTSSDTKLDTVNVYWSEYAEFAGDSADFFKWTYPSIDSSRIRQRLVVMLKDSQYSRYCTILESYDTSGKRMDGGTLRDGNGLLREYHLNGNRKSESEFLNGEFNGLQKIYDRKGRVESLSYFYGYTELSEIDTFMETQYKGYKVPHEVGLKVFIDTSGKITSVAIHDMKGNELFNELGSKVLESR